MSGVAKFIGTVAGIAAVIPGPHQPIAAAVAVAANVTAQLTARKPAAMTGGVNRITIGANQPKPYLIGETYYGGNRINQEGFGGKVAKVNNPYLLLVDVYSGAGPIAGLVAPYLDFVPVTLNGNAATGYAANHLYVYHQTGRTPEPQALSTHWGGAQTWGPQHKLSSYAAISWCLRFDEDGKRFAAGVPQTGAVWRGVLAYDPRKDSTYPGGSGPHRWADPTDRAAFAAAKGTWEWTRCPGLQGLRYALGTWERDETNAAAAYRKTFGIGIPIDGVRVADFVALANVCDANGWRVDGVIHEPGNRDENLKNILAAGGAERCWVGGKLGLKLSAPRVPLDTITEYDLATDEVEVGAMQGWESRLNTIIPKYRSADHKWEYVSAGAVTIASYLAEDGEEKGEERQFNLVQSKDQAAQLAAYELLDARELGEIVLTCKPRLRRYGAGDLLIVHLPDDGLVQQPCVVLKRTIDPVAMTVQFVLRGETAAKHDFALGRTGTAPATPRLTSPGALDDVAVDAPINWGSIVGDGKPDDNADVTGDNTAKDTQYVGGKPATVVISEIEKIEPLDEAQQASHRAILDAQLLAEERRLRYEDLTHVGGQPVGTVVARVDNERLAGDAAIREVVDLIGSKTADGRAFVLSGMTVLVQPGKTLAERLTEFVADADLDGEIDAKITEYDQVLTGDTGKIALSLKSLETKMTGQNGPIAAAITEYDKATVDPNDPKSTTLAETVKSLRTTSGAHTASIDLIARTFEGKEAVVQWVLGVGGKLSGVRFQGSTQSVGFDVKYFSLADPDTGKVYFYVDAAGRAIMHSVEVDTVKAKSIDSPALADAAASYTNFATLQYDVACPQSSPTTVVAFDFVKLDTNSVLQVQMFAQCYNVDDLQFQGAIVIDGETRQRAIVRYPFDNSNSRGEGPVTPFAFLTGIPAGQRSIAFVLTSNETEGPTYVRAGSTLVVTELRAASMANARQTTGGGSSGGGTGGGDAGGGGSGGGGGGGGSNEEVLN